ncbi:Sensor kinase CckA [Calidithermus terrae]|uniref:histidine kinase n=1 Tax=Calidithermus terrae TaxID=1408545 RepID=A0A399F6U7_9DEIN|nr:response regulator [Calidithermus terrae]RIH90602.1 Sensor kinase CckA [Calidithermus terrae]
MEGERGRILVVDDNRVNRLTLARTLEQQGHAVALAEDGRQALERLGQEPFDAVLLDILMPEMDGYAVLARMKDDPALRHVPVIVITALDEVDSAVRCIEMGAEDYLPKPFNAVFLRARLEASLRRKKLRDLEQAYLQQELMLRQSEKLATLGKLSAGIAHELGNPVAAAQRGAEQLERALREHLAAYLKLCAAPLGPEQVETLRRLAAEQEACRERVGALDPLRRGDLEAELERWLEDAGLEQAWEAAPVLVSMGYGPDALAGLAERFPGHVPALLAWLSSGFTVFSVLEEIGEGARRVHAIVRALKAYTYMDQAPVQNVDVHEGLENTLVMLRARLKHGVTVRRDYAPDLPAIEGYGGELNQLWTNLIDNAVQAMRGQGELTLATRRDGDAVVVEVTDTGPGIPPEIRPRIFDPFFTTKAPGEGTGLGLSISHGIVTQRHKGSITVESRPGRTTFRVRLPLRLERGMDEAAG